MNDSPKKPPILNPKNKVVFNKIVLIYAIFYVALKAFAIIFMDQWFVENLVISLPIITIGLFAFHNQKNQSQNWTFLLIALATAIIVRINEKQWILYIHDFLN